jgi:hypothetical protein
MEDGVVTPLVFFRSIEGDVFCMALVDSRSEYILILELNLEAAPACLTGIAAKRNVYMSMMFSIQEDLISIRRPPRGRQGWAR